MHLEYITINRRKCDPLFAIAPFWILNEWCPWVFNIYLNITDLWTPLLPLESVKGVTMLREANNDHSTVFVPRLLKVKKIEQIFKMVTKIANLFEKRNMHAPIFLMPFGGNEKSI